MKQHPIHIHAKCKHNIKFCEHCDICYCTKCNQEWKKELFSLGGTSTITWPKLYPNNKDPNKYKLVY